MALRELEEGIRTLQKRQNELQSAFTGLPLLRGTTAARDAAYGVPTTDAQRAALANQRVNFYNVELGWQESYYAVTGTTGLTARGLLAGVPAGWYPTGPGPRGKLGAIGAQSHTSGSFFTNWNNFGTGLSFRTQDQLIDRPTPSDAATIRTNLPGRYDLECRMTFQNGSGTGVWSFSYIDGAPTPATYTMAQPITLMSGYGQIMFARFPDVVLYNQGRSYVKTEAASWALGDAASWMTMRYIGPALAVA